MQVIILATDEQPPLSPLTEFFPLPMLPLVDRPVMATAVELAARAGCKRATVCLHHRGNQIAAYFGDGRRWGLQIQYLTQRQLWGSAGSLRFAGGLISETTLVLPGNALVDLDVEAALAAHRQHGGLATAILHAGDRGPRAARLRLAPDGRILAPERDEPGSYTLSATEAYIFEPGALAHLPRIETCDITRDFLPALIAAGKPVHGHTMRGYWNPMDSISAFQEAQEVYLYSAYRQMAPDQDVRGPAEELRFPTIDARAVAPGIWVGANHSIHPSVKIAAPTYIGPGSWVGREVELGPAAVVGGNVVIDEEATISRSTVLGHIYVGRLVNVDERVVAPRSISDVVSGETMSVVDPFLIGPVDGGSVGTGLLSRVTGALIALLAVVLLSPLMLLLALVSLLTTGGVFARVPRLGHRSDDSAALRPLSLLRFRTHRLGRESGPFGRFVERLEVHRLPELFNVISGQLALVGVKPIHRYEVASLTEEWHQRRHETPAGFTGLWYVQTELDSSLDSIIVADVYYTATRSWRADMICVLQTPAAWARRVRNGLKGVRESEYVVSAG